MFLGQEGIIAVIIYRVNARFQKEYFASYCRKTVSSDQYDMIYGSLLIGNGKLLMRR
jgi:hypothetical protein